MCVVVSAKKVVCDPECSMSSLIVGDGRLLVALARAAPHNWIVPDSSLRTDINIALTSKVNDSQLSRECVLRSSIKVNSSSMVET